MQIPRSLPCGMRVPSIKLQGDAGRWAKGHSHRVYVTMKRVGPLFRAPFAGSDSGEGGEEGCATDVGIATPVCWTQEQGTHG